jgi:hypothetical protein
MVTEDVAGPRVARILLETYERRPANFEEPPSGTRASVSATGSTPSIGSPPWSSD